MKTGPLDDGDPYWEGQAPLNNQGEGGGIFRTLNHADIALLRSLLRKVHLSYFSFPLENREADKMIDAIGLETAEKLLERATKEGLGGRVSA